MGGGSVTPMRIVLCNAPPAEAENLAQILVEERLAACVNLMPVRSVYRWQGAVLQESEVTLLIKVSASRVSELRERIVQLHSYEVPEVVVLEVSTPESLASYVAFVRDSCLP